ncbi:hypothetical protein I4U23_000119 [Adineta vaga]|nr:hypothetical protein I4U23_000119 [Adineta vaga]
MSSSNNQNDSQNPTMSNTNGICTRGQSGNKDPSDEHIEQKLNNEKQQIMNSNESNNQNTSGISSQDGILRAAGHSTQH